MYQGPDLSCTGVSNCDTLTEVIETIDGFICGPGMVENIINNILNNTNLYNQFTSIVNNTVDCQTVWNCSTSSTTTSTTTLCPCTYYEYVSSAQFPGTFTYVECDTLQPTTVTAGGEVDTVCVSNNYPTIEIGKINVLNTGVCCSVITTTTTTTVFIQSFCNQVTAIGTVYIYWTNSNGYSEVMKIKDETVYICAQVGSIAFTGTGSISVVGSGTICVSDGECAPTTTSTTTVALPCVSYNLEASGPSGSPGETDWEALECNTNITVGGTIVYPNVVNTGCITDGSLLLGPKVIIVDSESCPTTTTTTTAVVSCVEISINAAGNCPAFPGYSTIEYTDCNGLYQTVNVSAGESPTFCSLVGGVTPAFTCGTGIITYGSSCTIPTTTTTSTSSSTTTTTTTIASCVEWTWEALGVNFSDLEYTDCDGLPAVVPAIDVTNSSGIICVYPGIIPTWNPAPTFGYHQVSSYNVSCPTTTTTTTFAPCTIWSWEAIGFNISGIRYVDCNGQEVYIDPDDVTNNSGDICVYPSTTPEWNPVSPGGTHVLGTTGDECVAPPTTTTTTTEFIPTYCYTLTANGKVIFYWTDVNGNPQSASIMNTTIYVCAQLDSVATSGSGLPDINGGITPCTSDSQCIPITTTTTSSSTSTTTSTSTSTSTSTTTTTTTAGPTTTTTTTEFSAACTCLDFNITQEDIDAAIGNVLYPNNAVLISIDKGALCGGGDFGQTVTSAGTVGICIKTSEIGTVEMLYYVNDNPVLYPATTSTYDVLYSACTIDGECAPTTTTTTTTV